MLHQRWRNVAFIHWQCDPEMLRPLLPANLEVDTFDGAVWIGLTPLTIEQSRPPAVPGLSSFPETNLRTYVIGPDGRDGLWFFSLEADSLSTVIAARCLLGVPYRWAAMTVDRTPQRCTYVSRRRRRSTVIGHHIVVGLGSAVAADDVALADWLTGRWRAWSAVNGRLMVVPVEHEPWPLVSAGLVQIDENLTALAGLALAGQPPLVHFADEVSARFGWPHNEGRAG